MQKRMKTTNLALLLLLALATCIEAQTCKANNVQCDPDGSDLSAWSNCGTTAIEGTTVNIGNSTATCNICGSEVSASPYYHGVVSASAATNQYLQYGGSPIDTNLPNDATATNQGYRWVGTGSSSATGNSITPGVIGKYFLSYCAECSTASDNIVLSTHVNDVQVYGGSGRTRIRDQTTGGDACITVIVDITDVEDYISIKNTGGGTASGSFGGTLTLFKLPFTGDL